MRDGLGGRLNLGSFREILSLDNGLGVGITLDDRRHKLGLALLGRGRTTTNISLGLGTVVSNILLHQTSGLRGALASQILQLVGLRADDRLKVLDLLVDDLTVADVDKRTEVGDGDGEYGKSPNRDKADQPVASEGSSESLEFVRTHNCFDIDRGSI